MHPTMGFVHVRFRVFSPDRTKSSEVWILVDTGSTLTWLPDGVLRGLGIEPLGVQDFQTAGGGVLRRPVGEALVELEGVRYHVPVAFGGPEDVPLLGVTALEILGFEVDPVTHRLRKAPYLVLAAA